jgi:hypothetical protein
MKNLIKETEEKLAEHGKSWDDVHYVSVYDIFEQISRAIKHSSL